MIYCYKCKSCGTQQVSKDPKYAVLDVCCNSVSIIRDYRAENAGFVVPGYMKSSNTSGRDDFLPTAKDYESPSDPDGGKGIREWNENHEGAFGNKSPKRPTIPAGSRKILPLGDGTHRKIR